MAQAERLEKQAKDLEANFRRAAHIQASSARDARVLKAIGDLREEVGLLRDEVKELKKLILENR